MDEIWDCVVVGGGAAGLSAALVLGRARRRTLVVDAGAQSNLAAEGVGGLLGHDGRPPAELYTAARDELTRYPSVECAAGEVVSADRVDGAFAVRLGDGRAPRARRVLLATGMQYRPPAVPGLAPLWGRSVFHCPFCHGWEARDQPLAVLARGAKAVHAALLLRNWSDDVVVLTDGPADPSPRERQLLEAAAVRVEEREVAELLGADGELTGVLLRDGTRLDRRGLMVTTTLHQRSSLAEQLGVRFAEATPLAADPVWVDAFGHTSAPGVFAAGDVDGALPQVAAAVAAGSRAAAAVVQSLLSEDLGLPVPWKEYERV